MSYIVPGPLNSAQFTAVEPQAFLVAMTAGFLTASFPFNNVLDPKMRVEK